MNGEQCDECLTTFKITEVKEKRCIFCGTETILKQDKDIAFKLSMFQNSLEQYFEKNSKNWRLNAVNETKKYLEKGLMDRDITRNLSWGVEVPFEEFSEKKLYVWVEAVLGYLTAAEYTLEQQDMTLEDFFSTSEVVKTYFVHGKDNIPFHTIILPALILAYNEKIKLPDFIISSEFIKIDSDKMSKSKGNVILVKNLIGQYHSDTIRFHFIYNNPEKKDAVFSEKALVMSHNKFLVGTLGNFVNRNLSFIHRKNNGVITEGKTDHEMKLITNELYEKVALMIQTGEIRSALEEIVKYIQVSNKYYDSQKPWIQVKNDLEGFNNTTYTCFFIMVNLANLLKPFLPKCSWNLNRLLGIKDVNKWSVLKINGDYKIKKPNLLYEKIDKF
jgi:methionyl-tRNA synthetase